MHNAGISEDLLKTRKLIRCPNCGLEFNLMYARAFACQGCKCSVSGYDNVMCPKCDCAFGLDGSGLAVNRFSSKALSDYMSKILSDYFKDFGENPSR